MYIHEQLHMHGRDAHLELSADINCVLRGERQEHEAAGAQRRRGRPARSGGEAAYARERSERNIPPPGDPASVTAERPPGPSRPDDRRVLCCARAADFKR